MRTNAKGETRYLPSLYPSFHLSIYPSFICPSICPSILPSFHLSIYPSILHLPFCPYIYPSLPPSNTDYREIQQSPRYKNLYLASQTLGFRTSGNPRNADLLESSSRRGTACLVPGGGGRGIELGRFEVFPTCAPSPQSKLLISQRPDRPLPFSQ